MNGGFVWTIVFAHLCFREQPPHMIYRGRRRFWQVQPENSNLAKQPKPIGAALAPTW